MMIDPKLERQIVEYTKKVVMENYHFRISMYNTICVKCGTHVKHVNKIEGWYLPDQKICFIEKGWVCPSCKKQVFYSKEVPYSIIQKYHPLVKIEPDLDMPKEEEMGKLKLKHSEKTEMSASDYLLSFVLIWVVISVVSAIIYVIPWSWVFDLLFKSLFVMGYYGWRFSTTPPIFIGFFGALLVMTFLMWDEIKVAIDKVKEKQEIARNLRESKRRNQKSWEKLKQEKDTLTREASLDFVNGKHLTETSEEAIEVE